MTTKTSTLNVESKKSSDSIQPTTASDKEQLIDNTSEATKDNKETASKTEQKAVKEETKEVTAVEQKQEEQKANTALVTYVGSGTWRDSKGKFWSKNERKDVDIMQVRKFTISDYQSRIDLQFMVEYGEMILVLV